MLTQSDTINLWKIVCLSTCKKISFTLHAFQEILQDMQTCFEYFGACLVTHMQSDSITL